MNNNNVSAIDKPMSASRRAPIASGPSPLSPNYGKGGTDTFGDYLRRIGKSALLTAEDEVDLAKRIEAGLFAGVKLAEGVGDADLQSELAWLAYDGRRAKDRFIEANLRLVVSIARHYFGRGTPVMDLVQDGNIGLVRAVEKFDFRTGYKFSTYATWWIRQALHRGIGDKSRMIRIPVHIGEKLMKIKRIRRELTSALDRDPTVHEVAEEAQMSVEAISTLVGYDREPISLNTPIGEGDGDISELIMDADMPQPDECATVMLQKADIQRCMNTLPSRDRSILEARFGLTGNAPCTLDQIAAVEGVTRERVRQLEKRALGLLRVPRLQHYLND
jgi:RNA polymerase primary sigma factor